MTYVQHSKFDGDETRWLPITYRHYWDFARVFCLRFEGESFVFDSPFLELKDEYADYFIVYKCVKNPDDPFDAYRSLPVVDILPVENLVMDDSRKQYVLRDSLVKAWANWEDFRKRNSGNTDARG
jgi:hypothetical protein